MSAVLPPQSSLPGLEPLARDGRACRHAALELERDTSACDALLEPLDPFVAEEAAGLELLRGALDLSRLTDPAARAGTRGAVVKGEAAGPAVPRPGAPGAGADTRKGAARARAPRASTARPPTEPPRWSAEEAASRAGALLAGYAETAAGSSRAAGPEARKADGTSVGAAAGRASRATTGRGRRHPDPAASGLDSSPDRTTGEPAQAGPGRTTREPAQTGQDRATRAGRAGTCADGPETVDEARPPASRPWLDGDRKRRAPALIGPEEAVEAVRRRAARVAAEEALEAPVRWAQDGDMERILAAAAGGTVPPAGAVQRPGGAAPKSRSDAAAGRVDPGPWDALEAVLGRREAQGMNVPAAGPGTSRGASTMGRRASAGMASGPTGGPGYGPVTTSGGGAGGLRGLAAKAGGAPGGVVPDRPEPTGSMGVAGPIGGLRGLAARLAREGSSPPGVPEAVAPGQDPAHPGEVSASGRSGTGAGGEWPAPGVPGPLASMLDEHREQSVLADRLSRLLKEEARRSGIDLEGLER